MWGQLRKLFQSTRRAKPEAPSAASAPGLTREMRTRYLALLNAPEGSDLQALRRAWKRELKQCHAGLVSDDPQARQQAAHRTREVHEAFRALERELF